MAGARFLIEPDAEARPVGDREAAIERVDRWREVDELAHPRVREVVEVLDDVDVARRDREVDVGGGGDRPADVVGREGQVVRFGPARQAAHAGEPAEVGEIRLDDVDVAALDERRRVPDRMDPLAGRDRRPGRPSDARQGGRVLGRDRLLDPARRVRFERDRELGRRVRRETAVHLDHEVDVRADHLADRGHDGDRATPVGRADPDARRAERVELHRPIAARHHADRELGDPGRLEVGLVPAVRVGGHAITEPATEELPDRDPEMLADEVEGGDVEGGKRGLAVLARPAVLETLDRPGQPLGVERVGADDVPGGELLDDRDERVGLVDRPDLAHAGQTRVGLELDEHELAPGRPDDRRPDVGDLHVASSGWAGWRAVRLRVRVARALGT
jgi:hypothetical protein